MKRMYMFLFFCVFIYAQNLDLAKNVWQVRLEDDIERAYDCKLPGTLSDAKIGKEFTQEDFFKVANRKRNNNEDYRVTSNDEPEFGALSRLHKFVGIAKYETVIDIPKGLTNKSLELFLERVLWKSEILIDGKKIDVAKTSLATPHIYDLGKLKEGKYKLEILIDNQMIYNVGDKGHGYGEHMQTKWNGVIGKIEIREKNLLNNCRIFTPFPTNKLEVEIPKGAGSNFVIKLYDVKRKKIVVERSVLQTGKVEIPVKNIKAWSDKTPNLYRLTIENEEKKSASFTVGFRTIERKENKLFINGEPLFLRGNLDNCHFPLTGYPATDINEWKRILQISKDNGLNMVRFHSYCPPQAAFDAADELGVLLQPEAGVWIDGWMRQYYKDYKGAGAENNEEVNNFLKSEIRAINNAYGNSPSYTFFCIGNELGMSNWQEVAKWLNVEKIYDNRKLYAASTARAITSADDYAVTHYYPNVGMTRERQEKHTNWDYDNTYSKTQLPTIAHEIGQWPVYPLWNEIGKYNGILRAWNLEDLRRNAEKNNVLRFNKKYHYASAQTQRVMYKDEVESFLRTPSCAGIQLLGICDYSGQGEALIGWLDSFWKEKGVLSAEEVQEWFAPVVMLAKFAKYVWTNNENYEAEILVHNYGNKTISAGETIVCKVLDEKKREVYTKKIKNLQAIPVGEIGKIGDFKIENMEKALATNNRYELVVSYGNISNRWPFFVVNPPEKQNQTRINAFADKNTFYTDDLEKAVVELKKGSNVVFLANKSGKKSITRNSPWRPVYWSTTWFPGMDSRNLGMWIDKKSILKKYPTPDYKDWIWYDILNSAKEFVLNDLPKNFEPAVLTVTDFHVNQLTSPLFELNIGAGKIIICGFDLEAKNSESAALKTTILNYAMSKDFQPKSFTDFSWLDKNFNPLEPDYNKMGMAKVLKEKEDPKSIFFIAAGGNTKYAESDQDWKRSFDLTEMPSNFDYQVDGVKVWRKDDKNAYWVISRSATIKFKVPSTNRGTLKIRFADPENHGRFGDGSFEDKVFDIPAHGTAIRNILTKDFHVDLEDCMDGVLELKINSKKHPNLMIDRIIFNPTEIN